MPTSSVAHITPSPTQLSQSAPGTSGATYLDFETLALHPTWKDAYNWAVRNNVLYELLSATNTTLLLDWPIALGTLLEYISSDEASQTLKDWGDQEPAANTLSRLAQVITQDPRILNLYTPLTQAVSATSQFHGKLPTHYIIALLTEKLAPIDPADEIWINKLRLWVLTHAMDRENQENVQDNGLRQVATKLRLACNQDQRWRSIFLRLRSRSSDFEELSKNIKRIANSLLTEKQATDLSTKERKLLQASISVASGKHDKDLNTSKQFKQILLPDRNLKILTTSSPIAEEISTDEEDQEYANGLWVQSGDDDGSGIIESKVDSHRSFAHQKLQGSGILLYCTEELQYLPYSWTRLNPVEQELINNWLEQGYTSPRPEIQYLAVVIWLALHLGRSLRRVLDIRISSSPESEWTINPETLEMSRLPPRRSPGWKPGNDTETSWITHPTDQQKILLPSEIIYILGLRLKGSSAKAKYIGNLWDASWEGSPEKLFSQEFKLILPRITGGMLGNQMAQRAFQETGDQTFARLISSHPRSVLPGACAYSSWSSQAITPLLKNSFEQESNSDNAMGSLLDPIEELLRKSIQTAARKIEALRLADDIVGFHNSYIAYHACELLAASGGRPIRDPFESSKHFDFDARFVYVSDKVSGNQRQARLVPLPDELCNAIKEDYSAHLSVIANALPHLADDINQMLNGTGKARIPYLFMLTEDGKEWSSVSESEIRKLNLFDWPLPLNHFRHRLSRKLRKYEIDPEIIDSILGHAETGTATHGDLSFRVWQDDINQARPGIEAVFSSLGFSRIQPWDGTLLVKSTKQNGEHNTTAPAMFGSELREKDRNERLRASIQDAKNQINEFTNGRKLAELSEAEIDLLSRNLLFKRDEMPHPRGPVKYQVLLKQIEREWRKEGKKARISKRYQTILEETSPFNNHASGALALDRKLRKHISDIPNTNISRRSVAECAVISAVLLCVENRITNIPLLKDILNGLNFRIVSLRKKLHLEYAKGLSLDSGDVPVKRYRIDERTAKYLDQILSCRKRINIHKVPDELAPLSRILHSHGLINEADDSTKLLGLLTVIVDQANAMTLPGIIAGYLAGRVESYSLTWCDWARLELEYPVYIPPPPDDSNGDKVHLDNTGLPVSVTTHSISPIDGSAESLLFGAREFIDDISGLVNNPEIEDKGYAIENRKKVARKILGKIKENTGRVSTCIQLFGRWTSTLLFRKTRGRYIQLDSVDRYLGALKECFIEAGYDADILSMDDEDITELYSLILRSSKSKDTKYVSDRLVEFHRWASNEYAIPDPDWNELPEVSETLRVSPGFISEQEYLNALTLLLNTKNIVESSRLSPALLLMLCYRYGLRGKEAGGLQRMDIKLQESQLIVYVQNNRFRKLKTQTSRRQIPLLFSLSDIERDLLEQWLAEFEAAHGNDHSEPLFFDNLNSDGLPDITLLKRKVISALKIVTQNPRMNLHHARHSVANTVAITITKNNYPDSISLNAMSGSAIPNAELTLLGRQGITRRHMWAIARFLGHIRRETTGRNYLHILGEISDSLIGLNAPADPGSLTNVIVIDEFPRLANVDLTLLEQIDNRVELPTFANLLKAMRLAARGRNFTDAVIALKMEDSVGSDLQSLLDLIGAKIKLSKSKQSTHDETIPFHLRLIQRLKESAWNRVIKSATGFSNEIPLPSKPSLRIDEIAEMIGLSRQILLWDRKHFELLTSFITYMKLSPSDYIILKSGIDNHKLNSLLEQFDIKSIRSNDPLIKKHIQIDTASTSDGLYKVTARCAFLIKENDSKMLRNSTELLVAFIAFAHSNSNMSAHVTHI